MLMKWLTRRTTRKARASATKTKRTLLRLESLESREVPATYTWVGGVSNDYQTAANWSPEKPGAPGRVPGATDTAVFMGGSNTSCDDASGSLGGLVVYDGWGGTISTDFVPWDVANAVVMGATFEANDTITLRKT